MWDDICSQIFAYVQTEWLHSQVLYVTQHYSNLVDMYNIKTCTADNVEKVTTIHEL